MIRDANKNINRIEEQASTHATFEKVILTPSDSSNNLFTRDLSVSLSANKTFGKYKNGDTIPSNGKSVKEVIEMALSEAIEEINNIPADGFLFGDKESSLQNISSQLVSLQNEPEPINSYNEAALDLPVGFRRINSFPLDSFSVFNTLESLQAYASGNPVAYYGQICSVTENEKIYIIKGDRSLKEIGSDSVSLFGYATSGDLSGYYPITNPSGFITYSDLQSYQAQADSTYVNWDTFSSLEKSVSFALETGLSSYNVIFSEPFYTVPSITCSVDGGGEVIYQTLIKNKTVNGCDVYFSDTIQEGGCVLNLRASVPSPYP